MVDSYHHVRNSFHICVPRLTERIVATSTLWQNITKFQNIHEHNNLCSYNIYNELYTSIVVDQHLCSYYVLTLNDMFLLPAWEVLEVDRFDSDQLALDQMSFERRIHLQDCAIKRPQYIQAIRLQSTQMTLKVIPKVLRLFSLGLVLILLVPGSMTSSTPLSTHMLKLNLHHFFKRWWIEKCVFCCLILPGS